MGGGREPELRALAGYTNLTCCPRRQPSRLGTAAAVTEEEHCTVERRAHLTYPEFMQQYVSLPLVSA